jgi:hypothetical protein
VSCHWAEQIRAGELQPRSPEEVLRAAVDVSAGPAVERADTGPFLGQDDPLERL